jgi:hypothetical protein
MAKRKVKAARKEPLSAPLDYETACRLAQEAEETYWREFKDPHSIHLPRAMAALSEARRECARAGLAEAQAIGQYIVRRTGFADNVTTEMPASEALALIRDERFEDCDVTDDDIALQEGHPSFTLEAFYEAVPEALLLAPKPSKVRTSLRSLRLAAMTEAQREQLHRAFRILMG